MRLQPLMEGVGDGRCGDQAARMNDAPQLGQGHLIGRGMGQMAAFAKTVQASWMHGREKDLSSN